MKKYKNFFKNRNMHIHPIWDFFVPTILFQFSPPFSHIQEIMNRVERRIFFFSKTLFIFSNPLLWATEDFFSDYLLTFIPLILETKNRYISHKRSFKRCPLFSLLVSKLGERAQAILLNKTHDNYELSQ